MGQTMVNKTIIDTDNGEILKEDRFFYYDGFNDKGFKYRGKQGNKITFFPDTLPTTLSEKGFTLLCMIAELANEENVLVYRIERKSKFSTIIYKPLDKDEISKRLRFKWGIHKFDKYWKELRKHCLKRIRYHDVWVWAVNPAMINRCPQIPPWLYEEFAVYMNPHMTKNAILKMQNMLKNLED